MKRSNEITSNYSGDTSLSPTNGEQFDVVSTSNMSATVKPPIVLKTSDTDITRIVFEPKIVNNRNDSRKSVEGKLIYERRANGGKYPTEDKVGPKKIRNGEIMELSLDTTATINLFKNLDLLYRIYTQYGIPSSAYSFVKIEDTSAYTNTGESHGLNYSHHKNNSDRAFRTVKNPLPALTFLRGQKWFRPMGDAISPCFWLFSYVFRSKFNRRPIFSPQFLQIIS